MKYIYLLPVLLFFAWACASEQNKDTSQKPIPVKVEPVQAIQDAEKLTYSGSIVAYKSVNAAFLVSGQIQSVEIRSGDYVHKGDLLATLDPADYRFALNAARAQYERAESEYKRLKTLYDKGSLTRSDLDKITSLYKEAKADLDYKEKQLRDTRLYASAEGWISFDQMEPGEVIKKGIPVFRIIHSKKVYAKFLVPEKEINFASRQAIASVSIPALGDTMLKAVVEELAPDAGSFSRSFEIKASLENEDFLLKPGMIAEVELTGKEMTSGIFIPAASVLRDASGETYVYLAIEGKARKQKINTGEAWKESVLVLRGLENGDSLIMEGQAKLYENASISIIQ